MLLSLEIRDVLIIDHLSLEFQSGLNVLTGETGAGKSILLDSLGFVLGWRGRADLVRQGQDTGVVTAEFTYLPNGPVSEILNDAGLPDTGELILRRTVNRDGRKQGFVNDRRVAGDILRRIGDCLIELQGQQDDKGLLDTKNHGALLDEFAGNEDLKSRVSTAWRDYHAAGKALEAAQSVLEKSKADEDFLRHAVAEWRDLAPTDGEEAQLDSRRRLMQAGEKNRALVQNAANALGTGAEAELAAGLKWLEQAADQLDDQLTPAISAVSKALNELGEAVQEIERVQDRLIFDPAELDMVEERLFAMRAMARKHGVTPDELTQLGARMQTELETIDNSEGKIKDLTAALAKTKSDFEMAAATLTKNRENSAALLDTAMTTELAPLKMDRAVFKTEVLPGAASRNGVDHIQFRVATNPGAPSGPLNKIASGGELSRFLLALKVCLAKDMSEQSLIFDEIDRGVGGATADAVGRRLLELGKEGQVLVVTHSPQVAALGNVHFRVEKSVQNEMTLSTVTRLQTDESIEEIARMLAGDTITPAAMAAALELKNS